MCRQMTKAQEALEAAQAQLAALRQREETLMQNQTAVEDQGKRQLAEAETSKKELAEVNQF